MIIHFDNQQQRLDYLKGNFKEIKPEEVKTEEFNAENEKKSQNTAIKSKKKAKKAKDDDTVQAE